MDWLAFMEKERNELANTGHIMDDETFITHLLNSLPQAEYKGEILVIKERLRSSSCNLAQVMQLLEDKYLSMKYVKGWEEEEDDYALFASLAKKKGHKNSLKDGVVTVERLDTRQQNCPDKKARKKRTQKTNLTKRRQRNLKRTVKERAKPICQKINVIIVEKWVILLRTARCHTKMLILLKKMSKTGNSPN